MKLMQRLRRLLRAAPLVAVLGLAGGAHAQGVALDDEALSLVHGQALFQLTNTSLNGLDFTRITLGADLQLNANLTHVRLGEYSHGARNGTGADIDLGALRFGRSDGTDAQRLVKITDPYFEFVYRNVGTSSTREVLGMRLGFGGIQGDIGVMFNSVSGSLLIDAGAAGSIDSHNDPLGGKRWDGSSCADGSACALNLAQLGLLRAGDANGPSRDFFISVLRQPVLFPAVNGLSSDPAMAGFWLNWRDRLVALGLNVPMPPNLPKPPGN
jgi:hypothetical protein